MRSRARSPRTPQVSMRRSFTLVELLISISMIALLASMSMFALFGAMEGAKQTRTRAQIVKLNELISVKWDEFLARPIRLGLSPSLSPRAVAGSRAAALRELMRMELPDRITDIADGPVSSLKRPALHKAYERAVRGALGNSWYQNPQPFPAVTTTGQWSYAHQGAECLYLIVSMMRDGRSTGLDFFMESEIGDVDEDGMNEILDGWGRPIEWLRWAPGFATLPGPDEGWGVYDFDDDQDGQKDDIDERGWPGSDDESELQSRDATASPDPFDPLKLDPRWVNPTPPNRQPYGLYPLIYSCGKDGEYAIQAEFDTDPTSTSTMNMFRYASVSNDPYYIIPTTPNSMFGQPVSSFADDNITNHLLDVE